MKSMSICVWLVVGLFVCVVAQEEAPPADAPPPDAPPAGDGAGGDAAPAPAADGAAADTNGTATTGAPEVTTSHPPMGRIVHGWFKTIISYFPYFSLPRFHWYPVYKKKAPPAEAPSDAAKGNETDTAAAAPAEGAPAEAPPAGDAPAGDAAPAEGRRYFRRSRDSTTVIPDRNLQPTTVKKSKSRTVQRQHN